ncbi:bacterial low temperature requirement A protein-domain-containing protein [Sporodiniella umbellata]|nr:bacterial low temperature requirement A protein-domain-containing protein [Sporodiniella umbellata]
MSGSMRRGPTLRGGRSRPGIGRSLRRNSEEEEERLGLTEEIELDNRDMSEKFETDEVGKPIYHHGDETFGDVLSHPFQEYNAHRHRTEAYERQVKRWSQADTRETTGHASSSLAEEEHMSEMPYILVLHFRQLKGNQRFALDHDTTQKVAHKLHLTAQEILLFNGVYDTDGLTDFLYKIQRDFSIKIHHKSETPQEIIEINSNCYLEFKPKHIHPTLSSEDTRRPFFQPPEPDLSAAIGEETAASWLELFYDLFYVATLSEFTHSHHIKDWASLGLYTEWFIITWWAWCASSLYTARFDTDDVVHHIYKLIEMCAVVGMAGSSEYFLSSSGYVYGYIALKTVLVVEYTVVFMVALMAKSKSRGPLACYIAANLISIGLWVASLRMLDNGLHRIFWYMGVLCEVLVNVIIRGDKTLSWAASHLAERLGLLTLIVLGENLMGLVGLVATAGTKTLIVLPNFMAVAAIFGFFFMYFEDFNKEVFLHNKYHQVWVYLHFPLHLCQVAFGIALIDILKINKFQLIRDHKVQEDTNKASAGHGTAATEHGTTEAAKTAGTEHGTAEAAKTGAEHETSQGSTNDPTAALHHAKRAIEDIQAMIPSSPTTFPSKIAMPPSPPSPTVCQSLLSSVLLTAFHIVSYCHPSIESHGPLQRRSESASSTEDGEFVDSISTTEIVFVYKTFLIFGGLILVINSMIKAINTRLTDIYGKIIIASRLINAIVLWSLCALPFAKLDAIVLLSTMLGSLLFQALVDLLD